MSDQYPDQIKRNQAEDMHKRRAAGRWRRRVLRGEYGPLFVLEGDRDGITAAARKMKRGDVLIIIPTAAMVQP